MKSENQHQCSRRPVPRHPGESKMSEERAAQCNDRQIWEAKKSDRYLCPPSIHVTDGDGIGMNVAGSVYVMPIEAWHKLPAECERLRKELTESDHALEARQESYSHEWAELVSKLGDAERSRDSALASLAKAKEEVAEHFLKMADHARQCDPRTGDQFEGAEFRATAFEEAADYLSSSPASPVEKPCEHKTRVPIYAMGMVSMMNDSCLDCKEVVAKVPPASPSAAPKDMK